MKEFLIVTFANRSIVDVIEILIIIIRDMRTVENYPEGTHLAVNQRGLLKRHYILNNSTIEVANGQIDLLFEGNNNRIRIEDAAGKVKLVGRENQIDLRRSWVACAVEGNRNVFTLAQTEFQLKEHQGEGNYIPGIIGENPQNVNRRQIHERIINMRFNALKVKHQSMKKFLPSLPRSQYNSESRECTICYDTISPQDNITALFCFHFFHSACIEACLENSTRCPVCSLDLLAHISGEIKSGQFVQKQDELLMKESLDVEEQPQSAQKQVGEGDAV